MKTPLAAILLLTTTMLGCHTEPQSEPERLTPSAQPSPPVTPPTPAAVDQPLPASVAVAGVASCQPSSEVSSLASRAMALADADGNGQVSREEAESMVNLVLGGAFFRADQNGDGKITPEEGREARNALLKEHPALAELLTRARESTGAAPFKSLGQLLDVNYGQALSLTDARAAANTAVNDLFKMADRNKDGTISRQEALAAANEGAEAIGEKAFAAADANHDQFLSEAEFQEAASGPLKTVFELFDTNKDGKLTETEASAAMNAAGLRLGIPKVADKP
ncbi:MAG: EF-hand domain-containing protein [Polyangiaceae bacterium]